jgi:hypothetical protein
VDPSSSAQPRSARRRRAPFRAGPRRGDYRRADNDDAAAHHRRRRDLKFAWPFQLSDLELDLAANAETGAGNPGFRIERDHADVIGAHENPRATGCGFGNPVVDPIGDTPAGVAISRPLGGRDFRIVSPLLRAGTGIERDDLVEGRTEDQAVLDQQGRCLEFRARHYRQRAGFEIAGTKFPGADETIDIGRRDLGER